MEPSLQRQGSVVPVSLHQSESTVLPIKTSKAWAIFKNFKLETLIPGKVKSTQFVTGGPNQLDSVLKIEYNDGASWQIRINEISEIRHTIGYEVLTTEPVHQASSIQGLIVLRPVTSCTCGKTFVEWVTDFSNDADA